VALTALLPIDVALAFAIGAAIRRPFVVLLVAAVWPLYYAGLVGGFWGSGVGDSWALAGVVSGRAFAPRRRLSR
jgi:hypothetical protein